MATYRGEIIVTNQLLAQGPDPAREREVEGQIAAEMAAAHRRRPRTLRRFVHRGGELVEVESVVRETR
jgi:hypothetical protein